MAGRGVVIKITKTEKQSVYTTMKCFLKSHCQSFSQISLDLPGLRVCENTTHGRMQTFKRKQSFIVIYKTLDSLSDSKMLLCLSHVSNTVHKE